VCASHFSQQRGNLQEMHHEALACADGSLTELNFAGA
jgi:hypothetical protein